MSALQLFRRWIRGPRALQIRLGFQGIGFSHAFDGQWGLPDLCVPRSVETFFVGGVVWFFGTSVRAGEAGVNPIPSPEASYTEPFLLVNPSSRAPGLETSVDKAVEATRTSAPLCAVRNFFSCR